MSESKELLEKMIHVETRPRRSPARCDREGFSDDPAGEDGGDAMHERTGLTNGFKPAVSIQTLKRNSMTSPSCTT